MNESDTAKEGDYVLATRWPGGEPSDPAVVGFVGSIEDGMYYLKQPKGLTPLVTRAGFRRAEKITKNEGDILSAIFLIDRQFQHKPWWWWLDKIRNSDDE